MSVTITKDPTIKLFGKTIPFQDPLSDSEPDRPRADSPTEDVEEKDKLAGKPTEAKQEPTNPDGTLGIDENPKTPSGEETAVAKETEEEQSQTSAPQEKTLKKPDKILPCPRCKSMDTKFCYYNNYNVNQARHFCKSCQRYWTAGGTMRNVPVGAGRRKTKNSNSASHFRHIPSSEANGTVLTFGPDAPLCESMASKPNGVQENGEDRLNGSSDDDADKNESVESVMQNCPPTLCYPGAPWPYPWNSPMPPPFFFPPGFPMPFYPTAPYWGCAVPGSCNIPWFVQPPSPNQADQTLGKHSRDEEENENNSKRCLWIPKTLRVDDPGEAAKSSIWATLGIKYDKADSVTSGGLFKAFRSKLDEKSHVAGTSPALHANPAALSRSLNFQESS